jgi:hypothetical protein
MQARASQRQGLQTEQRAAQAQPGFAGQRRAGPDGSAGMLLSLQHSHGNRFVQRLLGASVLQRDCGYGGACVDCAGNAQTEEANRSSLERKSSALPRSIQAKLAVSRPGDPYEQEADRVADQVLDGITAAEPTHSKEHGKTSVQRAADAASSDENAEENPLIAQISSLLDQDGVQAKTESDAFSVSEAFESELYSTKGAGQPISPSTREEMETTFGADFGNVRLHTDNHAVHMSRQIDAHAFTHGNDIYFNEGMLSPSTNAGKHLLAHELTHTIQQRGKKIHRLSITQNTRDAGDCGSRRVRWTFTLDNPASADGYIVQNVRALETIESCPSNVSSMSLTPTIEFWEAWKVNAGDTHEQLNSSFGYTDQSSRAPEPTKSGTQASLGTVKFFLRSVTGDLGSDGVAPTTPGSSWGPGNAPPSLSLPSTLNKPSWWNGTPAEGPARRWASSWNCCGDASSHFSKIDSNP